MSWQRNASVNSLPLHTAHERRVTIFVVVRAFDQIESIAKWRGSRILKIRPYPIICSSSVKEQSTTSGIVATRHLAMIRRGASLIPGPLDTSLTCFRDMGIPKLMHQSLNQSENCIILYDWCAEYPPIFYFLELFFGLSIDLKFYGYRHVWFLWP